MLHVLVTLQILVTDRVERMKNERGATAVEYGLMVALIAAGIAVVVTQFGGNIRDMFNNTCNTIGNGSPSANTSGC